MSSVPHLPPRVLIARHLERLLSRQENAEKAGQLLARCGLTGSGETLRGPRGEITDEDCYQYKQALKEIFGDTVYRFGRVNFVLGGCQCRECRAQTA